MQFRTGSRIAYGPHMVTGAAPAIDSSWDLDLSAEEGLQKFAATVIEVKEYSAATVDGASL